MIGARIHGEQQLRRVLRMTERRVELASPVAVKAGADIVADQMRRLAPQLTGRLVARISADVATFGEGATARIGSDVPYDPFVQRGTVYVEPQAYGEEAAGQGAAACIGKRCRDRGKP